MIDHLLDNVDGLIEVARELPVQLKDRRLAMESSIIIRLAARLALRLRRDDPLATRVALSKTDFLAASASGACAELFRKRRSGGSSKQ